MIKIPQIIRNNNKNDVTFADFIEASVWVTIIDDTLVYATILWQIMTELI